MPIGRVAGPRTEDDTALRKRLAMPHDRRMWDLFRALARGWTVEQIHELTKIDPWFLRQFAEIAATAAARRPTAGSTGSTPTGMRRLKRAGFGDAELALATGTQRSGGPRSARVARA